jgi:hypothetical protein
MKAYWASGGIGPLIPVHGTRWRWVVSFTPQPLYPLGKNPSQPLQGLEPPIIQPVAQSYTTELSRLRLDAVARRKYPCPRREWNPCSLARSLATILSYRGSLKHQFASSKAVWWTHRPSDTRKLQACVACIGTQRMNWARTEEVWTSIRMLHFRN